ncbi:DUF4935 domain-containing protein [Curtobacterium sp. VKM Ac-2861]|uniref:PIN domain-containing protein n=1 Tax=Curtobacterium sp. VKM Ac-2861 TaxID=2739016 RepID=UPI00156302B4|nr:DUF4935 domain-containing protein [Curtobacterium sp. VKM Ac-2861]
MILVPDANAIVPNPQLQGGTWRAITTAIRDGALTVVVPRIVAAEVTGKVRQNRRDQRPRVDVHRAPDEVKQAVRAAADEVERWASQYDATIYLEAEGVTIRDTPVVPHDEVAQRAIDRGKPFNEDGGGYRDALHWYTVLDLAREFPHEEIVFISKDLAYRNNKGADLHPELRDEIDAILTTGTIRICKTLNDFVPPQKYSSSEDRVVPEAEHLGDVVRALFPNGELHAPELWIALDLDEPVDADVSDPGAPELVWAFARDLVDGGRSYRTRIRMTARVAFDWIDWPDDDDESSYQDLDITAWYTVDDHGIHVDRDRTDIQPAPIYTGPRFGSVDAQGTRTLTSSAFSLWERQQINSAVFAAQQAAVTKSSIAAEIQRRATEGANLGSIAAEIQRRAAEGTNLGSIAAEIQRRAAEGTNLGSIAAEIQRRAAEGTNLGSIAAEIQRRAAENTGVGSVATALAHRELSGSDPAWSALSDSARRAARSALNANGASGESKQDANADTTGEVKDHPPGDSTDQDPPPRA